MKKAKLLLILTTVLLSSCEFKADGDLDIEQLVELGNSYKSNNQTQYDQFKAKAKKVLIAIDRERSDTAFKDFGYIPVNYLREREDSMLIASSGSYCEESLYGIKPFNTLLVCRRHLLALLDIAKKKNWDLKLNYADEISEPEALFRYAEFFDHFPYMNERFDTVMLRHSYYEDCDGYSTTYEDGGYKLKEGFENARMLEGDTLIAEYMSNLKYLIVTSIDKKKSAELSYRKKEGGRGLDHVFKQGRYYGKAYIVDWTKAEVVGYIGYSASNSGKISYGEGTSAKEALAKDVSDNAATQLFRKLKLLKTKYKRVP